MYRGLTAIAAEWQFANLGFYHPAITFLLLLLLLTSPVLVWNRFQKSKPLRVDEDPDLALLDHAIVTAINLRNIIRMLSLITAFCALAIGIYALVLPATGGVLDKVTITGEEQAPTLGLTQLQGKVLFNKVAVLHEDFVTRHHITRFAPVVSQDKAQSKFRFFVELKPTINPQDKGLTAPQIGFLRKSGLPGGLVQLYRSAGFTVGPDYYVLFSSVAEMRRPFLIDTAEFLITSLCLGLLALFASYRVRRLKRAKASLAT